MEKKKECEGYEMPIPEEAKGMQILLIDHDVASLMHTTSMLEEATYKVTSAMPDIALSMMKERSNQYDFIMADVQMQGMDCISFLKLAKRVSNIPVAFMSYKEDLQTAIRSIQQGACQYFVKPISRNDIRGLWQFILRKERNIPENEGTVNHSNDEEVVSIVDKPIDPKGKAKEIMVGPQEIQEHENLSRDNDDGKQGKETEMESRKRKGSNNKEKVKNKKGRKQKKRVKWNAELHAKFMKVLMAESREENQVSDISDVTNLTQAASQTQLQFTSQNSKEKVNHPSDGNLVRTREANGPQSQNIARVSPVLMTRTGGYANSGSHMPIDTGGMNLGIGTRINENTSRGASFSYNTKSQFGAGEPNNNNHNISLLGGSLTERVHQIRRAYRTNSESGKASTASKTHASIGNQVLVMNDSNQNRNQANHAMRIETIESMMVSGVKRNRSQYENADSSSKLAGEQAVMFGETMVENYGHIGSSNDSTDFGFNHLLNVPQQNPNPFAVQSPRITTPNYAPFFMQNACNIQTESSQSNDFWLSSEMTLPSPTYFASQVPCTPLENYASAFMQNAPQTENPNPNIGFMQNACNMQMESNEFLQALNYSIWSTNNEGILGSRDMPTGFGDVIQGMPLEVGLIDQAERLTSDFGGQNREGFGSINSTNEGFLTDAQANGSQQATNDDDASLDEIFAELRPHFVDDEIRNSISNTNNGN